MSQNNDLEKHFTASALIIDNGKVLLLHHKKLGVWFYPGGHVEKNETPEQTVIREVKEETGLDVEINSERDDNLADINTDVSALYKPNVILCEIMILFIYVKFLAIVEKLNKMMANQKILDFLA